MDIWLVNPYGPIPGEGWRDYRFTLAGHALARRGHKVTWWTAGFAHQTKEFRSREWASRVVGERFTVELVPTPSYSRNVGIARLWFELIFARRFLRRVRSLPRPDVIIAADPPQFCGAAGRRLAVHFGIPFVIDCLDLWPELFIRAAPAGARPFVRIATAPLFALRRRNVRAADLVIAVAQTYQRAIARTSDVRAMTIPIGVDVASLAAPCTAEDRKKVRVIYAGSLGEAYDLDTVIKAARLLREEPIEFVIAGRGPAEGRLRDRIAMSGLDNVTMAGHVSADELPRFYGDADLALAPYAAGSTVALPVKLFDYLAAGLPVITSLNGEALDVLTESSAGVVYESGDAWSLADAVRSLATDGERRRLMAAAARSAASRFDSAVLYEEYAEAVESVVKEAQTGVSVPHRQAGVSVPYAQARVPVPHAQAEVPVPHAQAEVPVPHAQTGVSVPHAQKNVAGPQEQVEIRAMTRRDVRDVVSVHLAAFPDFFLSSLGAGFLSQFYGAIIEWPEGVAVVAAIDGRIGGFAVGSTVPKNFYRRLFIRRSLPIAIKLLPVFARRPSAFVKVVRRVVGRASGGPDAAGTELMSLAVAPSLQHGGIGRALLDAFTARVAEARSPGLWLTTDAIENDSVKRFYERAGFVKSRSFTNAEGRKLDEYTRHL